MKIITGILMFVTMGAFANAQQTPPSVPATAPLPAVRVMAELGARAEGHVKNAPFSADAVSESVQTLADGNRIVRNSTSKLYRNSEGRFRREGGGGTAGILGSYFELQNGVSIVAPDAGYRYYLNPESKTGRSITLSTSPEAVISSGGTSVITVPAPEAIAKIKEEWKAAAQADGGVVTAQSPLAKAEIDKLVTLARTTAAQVSVGSSSGFAAELAAKGRNTRTEQLGVQNIEGVDAEGTRTITTIDAGAIGNERPIEIVYERWYSKELHLVVLSKHSDPRFGEQTYRVTNIVRSEPDPSLFKLPNGYNITNESNFIYKTTAAGKGQGRNTYTVKAPTAVNVKSTKP